MIIECFYQIFLPEHPSLNPDGSEKSNESGNFACDNCGKVCNRIHDMRRHILLECESPGKLACPYCKRHMKTAKNLYRHVEKCHPGRPLYLIDLNDKELPPEDKPDILA